MDGSKQRRIDRMLPELQVSAGAAALVVIAALLAPVAHALAAACCG